MIALETGKSIPYSINNLQERGKFFIGSNEDIYEGQVVGENSRPGDMVVNLTKAKKLTNIRSAGADDKLKLIPPRRFFFGGSFRIYSGRRICRSYTKITPPSENTTERPRAQTRQK